MRSKRRFNGSAPGAGLSRRQFVQTAAALGLGVGLAQIDGAGPRAAWAAPADQLSGAVEFWSRETADNGARQPLVAAHLAAFDAANGTKSTPQYMVFQESIQKMQAALAAGSPPEVGQQGPDVTMQFAAAGHLQPLDDVLTTIGRDRFAPLGSEAYVVRDGVTYSIPWYIETRVLYYHKDLLAQAGVNPPTTWAEWVDAAKALTNADQIGYAVPMEGTNPGQLFVPLGISNGGSVLDQNGKVVVNSAPMREALEYVTGFYTQHQTMSEASLTYKNAELFQLFLLKKIAMITFNGELYRNVRTQTPELADTVGAVTIPVNRPGDITRSFLGGWQLFAFKNSKNLAAGLELLKWLYDDAWYTDYMVRTEGSALPVMKSTLSLPFYTDDPIRKVLIEQEQTAVRYSGPYVGVQPFMGEAEGKLLFSQAVTDVVNGKKSVGEALTTLESQIKQLAGQA
ncbi:MAG: extracellular solute-binding protein [Chloroflexota bacterium]